MGDVSPKSGPRFVPEAIFGHQLPRKSTSPDAIYRFLDELCARGKTAEQVRKATDESIGVKWQVEQIAFEHTKAVMGGTSSAQESGLCQRLIRRLC